MRRPAHGRFFNFFYITALILIVMVFGAIAYLLATSNITLTSSNFNALTMVIMAGSSIGVLALLTGAFFVVSRLDTRLTQKRDYSAETGEDEPSNYGAPRL